MHRKQPGEHVGRYIIEGFLGSGGMGEVYEATDSKLGRRVALKMLRKDAHPSAAKRLLREARMIAGFEHPNAVTLFDADEIDGEPFVAMELVRGSPMRAFVGDETVPLNRKLRWLMETARALSAAHEGGLVHRDIKPDNILIRKDGTAKVLDFGIARKSPDAESRDMSAHASTITAENSIVGTPSYWAPEQLRGEAPNAAIDQFAWGVTAFELLTGRYPWPQGEPLVLLSHILTSEPAKLSELVPGLPEPVEQAIVRTLSKDKNARFADIDEAADILEPYAEIALPKGRNSIPLGSGDTAQNTPQTPRSQQIPAALSNPGKAVSGPLPQTSQRAQTAPAPRRAKRALIAAAMLSVALGGAYWFSEHRTTPDLPTPAQKSSEADRPLVTALLCSPADLGGSSALDELAPAIGIGTCARLALHLGVEWLIKGNATPVDVHAEMNGSDEITITASVLGQRESATEKTPLRAMNIVSEKLASQLSAPPLSQAEIVAWGADNETSARAIIRALRGMTLDIETQKADSVKKLIEQSPKSPFGPYLAERMDLPAPSAGRSWLDEALARTESLPPARRALFQAFDAWHKKHNIDLALKLSTEAYAVEPNDPLIAMDHGLLSLEFGAEEQGFAILERLYGRSPSYGIAAFAGAVSVFPLKDQEREGKYLAWIASMLPESLAWSPSVRHAQLSGQFDEARKRLALGLNLGTADADEGSFSVQKARAWLPLASFEPSAAREIASSMLSDPRQNFHQAGADILTASYVLEGRLDDADAVIQKEIERYRDDLSTHRALDLAFYELKHRRLLIRPMPGKQRMEWLAQTLGRREKPQTRAIAFQGELALAQAESAPSPKERKKILEQALRKLEQFIEETYEDDKNAHDTALIKTIHLLRATRGDKAAAERWLSCTRASYVARRYVALDAGLALEAEGNDREAEKAYRIAQDPTLIDLWPLQIVAARLKQAALLRKLGRSAEADKLDEFIARLWTKADPGLYEALLKLR